MTTNHAIHRLSSLLAASLLFGVAACGGSNAPTADPPVTADQTSDADSATYRTEAFTVPFDVSVPAWLPGPAATADQPNLVTWEPEQLTDPAVRFLAPVNVFPPGGSDPTPPPTDYLPYLLGQREQGAHFTDIAETTVDGRPATIVTATIDDALDGSLGCPAKGVPAPDCFGLQPDLALRIAVIDADEGTLLAWLRQHTTASTGEATRNIERFEEMLGSVRFRARRTETTTPAPAAATPVDGVWTTSITHDELESSPLLMDAGEVNDENWGDLTFTFDQGTFDLAQENRKASWTAAGDFEVDGSTLRLELDNGEQFAMRWSIDDDELTLTRDEELGIAPTPFVLKSWTRQA